MFSVVFMKDIAKHTMLSPMTSIPLKSLFSCKLITIVTILCLSSPAMSSEDRKQYHGDTDSRFPSSVAVSFCYSPKTKVGICRRESIHRFRKEGASMSSSASPTVLAVKYILDWEVLPLLIDTHNHSRLISSEVIAYNESTTRLHLHCKPVRNAKPHGGYLCFVNWWV